MFPGEHSNGHNSNTEATTTILVVSADRTTPLPSLKDKLIASAKERGLGEAIIIRRIVHNNSLACGNPGGAIGNETVAASHSHRFTVLTSRQAPSTVLED